MLSTVSHVRFGSITYAGKPIEFGEDVNLFQVLTGAGLMSADGTCQGGLACGKCKVKVVSGNIPEIEEEEAEIIEGEKGVRLACGIPLDGCDGAVFDKY